MKIRPQMLVGLLAVGCLGLAGVHFATAQQEKPRQVTQKFQGPDIAQAQKRGQRQTVRPDSKTRIDSKKRSSASVNFRSSVFIGAPVSISGGASMGTVQEFILSDGGCVDFVIVNYDNRLVAVPWMAGTFRAADRVFLLDIADNQLAQLPTFTDFGQLSDVQFVAKVNTFFKVDDRSRDRRAIEDRSKSARDNSSTKPSRDAGKTESGKSQPGTTPGTQEKPKAGASDLNRGAETKKTETLKKADEIKKEATQK